MLSDYQIMMIHQVYPNLIYLLVVSAVYLHHSRSIIKSAHGLMIVVAYVYAVIVSEFTGLGSPNHYYWPFFILIAIGLISAGYSFTGLKGKKKWVHLMHFGTFFCTLLVLAGGSMGIAHDWI